MLWGDLCTYLYICVQVGMYVEVPVPVGNPSPMFLT